MAKTSADPSRLDIIDRRILARIQRDATLPMAELAEQVGLSLTPCWRRVQKLALPQSVWRRGSILALNSSGPARPYMARLRVFRRLI
jgi:hypothetical protein